FLDLPKRLLLVTAGDRTVGSRPDEKITDRLFIVGTRYQRNANGEQLVGRLANVALIVLREAGGAPGLNLVRGKTSRAQHTAVDDCRTPHRANAAIDACQDFIEHLTKRRRLAHVARDLG